MAPPLSTIAFSVGNSIRCLGRESQTHMFSSREILISEHMSVREGTRTYCDGRHSMANYNYMMQHWRIVPRAMKFELEDGVFCHWSSYSRKCGNIEPPYNKRFLDSQPTEGKG